MKNPVAPKTIELIVQDVSRDSVNWDSVEVSMYVPNGDDLRKIEALISAAPKMLEALEAILKLEFSLSSSKYTDSIFSQVSEVIKQAKGA